MNDLLATYSFLPWMRQGLANRITAGDMDPGVKLRASLKVKINVVGQALGGGQISQPFEKDVQLYGPGDIVGIERRSIVKVEPRHLITNFEPNYLGYIDFYDEDFPWRYTPAQPSTTSPQRLRPWITLVVLSEDEFEDTSATSYKPLPRIRVFDRNKVFPNEAELWAWAHVHVNSDLVPTAGQVLSTDMNTVLPQLQALLGQNADLAYSRLLCPRKLKENAAYHAFVVPTFESGRLAGLGLSPDKAPHATFSAWADYADRAGLDGESFPYYYRWYFRSSTKGDFEYLVRLLEPKLINKDVGRRDMDVRHPGQGLSGIDGPDSSGVLKLGGALRIPYKTLKTADKAEVDKYENWDQPYPQDFQKELAAFINLADDYERATPLQAHSNPDLPPGARNGPDPLITPPLYGRWHAMTRRLLYSSSGATLPNNSNWVHNLNLDPRHRVAAGFGIQVVQKSQEEYMDSAWEQVGDIIKANRLLRLAELARAISQRWYTQHFQPLQTANVEKAIALTAPVHNRLVDQGYTISHRIEGSLIPGAATSPGMRRLMRPGGRMAKSLTFSDTVRPDNLLARINGEQVTVAPDATSPEGVVSLNDVADQMLEDAVPDIVNEPLRNHPWLKFIPLILILILSLLIWIFPSVASTALGAVMIAGAAYLFRLLRRWSQLIEKADGLRAENQTEESVDALPGNPDFTVSGFNDDYTTTLGGADNPEATRFKEALRDLNGLLADSFAVSVQPERVKLNLNSLSGVAISGVNPDLTIRRNVFQKVVIPKRLSGDAGEELRPVMAYPEFDKPMYKPLTAISGDMFLPNIDKIEQNSISLLETNQKFIESYMAGLNHEFARELLWREYPTDQRGSYFRQFWDPSGVLVEPDQDTETTREKLKDIPPLHIWRSLSKLGDHDHREQPGDNEEELVLVIRGELLKKYPTAVIYAHRAAWQRDEQGRIDNKKERVLAELVGDEKSNPPQNKVKTPMYEAKVDPDIYFFGFDLTDVEALGESGDNESDDPGWFFVIQERPGEPRFGLDIDREGPLNVWNDLAWNDVIAGNADGAFIPVGAQTPTLTLSEPTDPSLQEKHEQWEEDKQIKWSSNLNSAELAYILYQAPVLVAVHACEMLPGQ